MFQKKATLILQLNLCWHKILQNQGLHQFYKNLCQHTTQLLHPKGLLLGGVLKENLKIFWFEGFCSQHVSNNVPNVFLYQIHFDTCYLCCSQKVPKNPPQLFLNSIPCGLPNVPYCVPIAPMHPWMLLLISPCFMPHSLHKVLMCCPT